MWTYFVRRIFQLGAFFVLFLMAILSLYKTKPDNLEKFYRRYPDVICCRGCPESFLRLRSYLRADQPTLLQYTTWLLGDDWLGADWMYLGFSPYKVHMVDLEGQPLYFTNPITKEDLPRTKDFRFWVEPSKRAVNLGTYIWVWGDEVEQEVIEAERIVIRNRLNPIEPKGYSAYGNVFKESGDLFEIRVGSSEEINWIDIQMTETTEFSGEEYQRSDLNRWVNVSKVFGEDGVLGAYANFHSERRGLLRLDFGNSWVTGGSVKGLIAGYIKNSLTLMLTATLVSLLVGIPIGIHSAVQEIKGNKSLYKILYPLTNAIPEYWLGLMLILIFTMLFAKWGLPYFPSGGAMSIRSPNPDSLLSWLGANPKDAIDQIVHMILPVTALSFTYSTKWGSMLRDSLINELRKDYVRVVRAKGVVERAVIYKHALRNASIPLVLSLAGHLPYLLFGAIMVEQVFFYPGMGRLLIYFFSVFDLPVLTAVLFIMGLLTVLALLLQDGLKVILDPRVKLV